MEVPPASVRFRSPEDVSIVDQSVSTPAKPDPVKFSEIHSAEMQMSPILPVETPQPPLKVSTVAEEPEPPTESAPELSPAEVSTSPVPEHDITEESTAEGTQCEPQEEEEQSPYDRQCDARLRDFTNELCHRIMELAPAVPFDIAATKEKGRKVVPDISFCPAQSWKMIDPVLANIRFALRKKEVSDEADEEEAEELARQSRRSVNPWASRGERNLLGAIVDSRFSQSSRSTRQAPLAASNVDYAAIAHEIQEKHDRAVREKEQALQALEEAQKARDRLAHSRRARELLAQSNQRTRVKRSKRAAVETRPSTRDQETLRSAVSAVLDKSDAAEPVEIERAQIHRIPHGRVEDGHSSSKSSIGPDVSISTASVPSSAGLHPAMTMSATQTPAPAGVDAATGDVGDEVRSPESVMNDFALTSNVEPSTMVEPQSTLLTSGRIASGSVSDASARSSVRSVAEDILEKLDRFAMSGGRVPHLSEAEVGGSRSVSLEEAQRKLAELDETVRATLRSVRDGDSV